MSMKTWQLKTWRFWGRQQNSGEGDGPPLQCSCRENPMDGGAWWAAVDGVAKSRAQLSDFTFSFHFHALEKEMATHSSILAWRIPETEEPSGLPSIGLHRVGHNWSDLAASAAAKAVLRGKLIAIQSYLKKQDKHQVDSLNLHP